MPKKQKAGQKGRRTNADSDCSGRSSESQEGQHQQMTMATREAAEQKKHENTAPVAREGSSSTPVQPTSPLQVPPPIPRDDLTPKKVISADLEEKDHTQIFPQLTTSQEEGLNPIGPRSVPKPMKLLTQPNLWILTSPSSGQKGKKLKQKNILAQKR